MLPRFADEQPPPPPPPPREPERQRGGGSGGGILTGILVLMLVLPLVALALLLPPFSLGNILDEQLNTRAGSTGDESVAPQTPAPLTAETPRIEREGLVIEVAPDELTAPFAVMVTALDPAGYLAGNTPTAQWHCGPDLPPGYALASPVYSLARQGTPPARLTLTITALPQAAEHGDIEMRTWNANTQVWEFVAASQDAGGAYFAELPYTPRCVALLRRTGEPHRVGLALDLPDQFNPDVFAANPQLYWGRLRPTLTGALDVVLARGPQTGQGYDVIPLIQNFDDPSVVDTATIRHILENPAIRAEHARQIAAFALTDDGYTGVAIDYRAVPLELREAYGRFISDLANLLHGQGRTLAVIVPAPRADPGGDQWDTGGYDWAALGRAADSLVITGPLDPAAYAPDGAVDRLLAWAATRVSRSTLMLGLSAASVEDTGDGLLAPTTLEQALGYLGELVVDPAGDIMPGQTVAVQLVHPAGVTAEFLTDETTQTPGIRYRGAGGAILRTMWITDARALAFRMARAAGHDLGGVFVRNLMVPGVAPNLADALLSYRLETPDAAPTSDLALEWVVRSGEAVVAQVPGQLNQPFTFDTWERPGPLTIEARVAGRVVGSQTITVVQPEPTNTPTAVPPSPTPPEPTGPAIEIVPLPGPGTQATPTVAESASPTPSATATPTMLPPPTETAPDTPEPPPTKSPPDVSAIPTVDPALLATANIGSEFEAGAHLATLNRSLLQAGRAHLDWIALDVTYRIGSTPGAQQMNIEQVHGNAMKVLLRVSGAPDEFAQVNRAEYVAFFATFTGGLAAYGADAIEIWPDANMFMPVEDYAQILGLSYHAIKTANPNVMVISGAPSASETPDEQTLDDAAFYAQLADLGTARFMDCIGAQYTLGSVPPASASGDPRGDNPIYYLPTVTDRARNPFAGALPLCFTRFGYLSPEGYGPLPPDYAWAQNTTAAQQAQWLTDAARLSTEGTQVRLLIVWSLDADAFEAADPLAGYAIIRPDGSCPACEALAPLLEEPGE